jgi:two-component system chemotaxis sensor kinase CheA
VVVFHDGKRCIGLLVDQILDIVEEHITIRQPVDRIGLLGSTVIGGRVTDLLDLHAVIGTLGDQWFEGAARQKGVTVLVAEPSAFARGLIRSYLEMAGHHVLEAGTEPEALARLEQQPADVVLAAMDLSPRGAGGLRERLCEQPRLAQTPVVGLVEQLKDLEDGKNRLDGLLCYRQKFDREAVLDAVEKAKEARGAAELVAAGDRK